MRLKLPPSSQNWISLIGATVALISLFMIGFLFVLSTFMGESRVYLGLVIFILLPAVMVSGLILIPIGMFIQIHRDRKSSVVDHPAWPRIDLNDDRHRNAFFIFSIGTAIFLFLSALGSYEAFHYTESIPFCGRLCHYLMTPEYTAYQNSPHARVACVQCHVGPGANWYVRSKLSGMYQVYATLSKRYPKPIPTPIENLRPAREVCEQCHWPQKFYAHKLRLETHYLNDEKNTRWDIRLIMKIGAEHSALGLEEGIHWHINPNVKIEYIATDNRNEEIPWVRYINLMTGDTIVYEDQESPIDPTQRQNLETRVMDCMDCHNRPSHNYRAPAIFINEAMTAGTIPVSLPEIKSVAMEILSEVYTTTDSALQAIRDGVEQFYADNYPALVDSNRALVEQAIQGIQAAFSRNIFPEMRVRWDAYPNNIGHQEFKGCFRCHNNTHVSKNGLVIRRDCNLCHYINAQGIHGHMEYARVGETLTFKHPVDIDEAWKESLCTDCHTGLNP